MSGEYCASCGELSGQWSQALNESHPTRKYNSRMIELFRHQVLSFESLNFKGCMDDSGSDGIVVDCLLF